MKKYRSVLILILVLSLVFTFAACGSKDSGEESAPSEQNQAADNSGTAAPEQSQSSDQSSTPSDQSSTPSQDQQSQESTNSVPENLTPPSRSGGSSDSSEVPMAEITEKLDGDYTGEFTSNTGTALNLIVRWAANYSSDDSLDVTLNFYLSTYSLQVSDRSGNKLEVKTPSGTESYTFATKEVNKKDNKLESILIGQTMIKLSKEELEAGADVKATWDFRGSYSDKSLPEVVAEGKIKKD